MAYRLGRALALACMIGSFSFAALAGLIGGSSPSRNSAAALTPLPTMTPPHTATPRPARRISAPTALPRTATPRAPVLSDVAQGRSDYIPILMYHYVREVAQDKDPLGFRLSVTPQRFEEQMAWLSAHGYTALPMRAVAACLRQEFPCPKRAVAITFDDGYADSASNALPVLERYNLLATFYIVSGFVGKPGYMGWDELALLRDRRMEIGSHTVSHADLTGLSLEEARAELTNSRAAIEARLGVDVVSFSYPAGHATPELAALVRELGYTSAVVTRPGNDESQLYQLPRRRVLGGETIEAFRWAVVPIPQ